MRVLVAYGSKMGGTADIATWLADELQAEGMTAEARPAREVHDLHGYDAVVVGGSLYMYRWHRDARHFMRHHAVALRMMPVYVFSSGPLDDSAAEHEIEPIKSVSKLMESVGAREHMTFGGRMPADARGFPASSMAKNNAGDWRHPALVQAWAHHIAAELSRSTGQMAA